MMSGRGAGRAATGRIAPASANTGSTTAPPTMLAVAGLGVRPAIANAIDRAVSTPIAWSRISHRRLGPTTSLAPMAAPMASASPAATRPKRTYPVIWAATKRAGDTGVAARRRRTPRALWLAAIAIVMSSRLMIGSSTAMPGRTKSRKSRRVVPTPKPRPPSRPKATTWTGMATIAKTTPRERSIIRKLARKSGSVTLIAPSSAHEAVGTPRGDEQDDHPDPRDTQFGTERGQRLAAEDHTPNRGEQ